jgi:DNA-binding ferritin-like protein
MEKIIQNLLTILNQLKYYHWATNSFARHEALGKAYDELNDKIDEFVEILIAKYGKSLPTMSITIHSKSEIEISAALGEIVVFFTEQLPSVLNEKDTDLINLKDEMLAVINRTKYLFTLK